MDDMRDLLLIDPALAEKPLTIWIEHANGSRQSMANVINRKSAIRGIKEMANKWLAESTLTDCLVVAVDELTVTFVVSGQAVATLYADPLPDRPDAPGDVRIDRMLVPRHPIGE